MITTQRGEETRRRLMEYIQENPGVNKLELQKGTGIGWGTTMYNVDILERKGRLQSFKDRGHVRLFDIELDEEEMKFFCALKDKHADGIIAQLNEDGTVQAYDVADDLGVSRKVIRRTMLNMAKHGLLDRQGKAKVYFSLSDQAKRFFRKRRK